MPPFFIYGKTINKSKNSPGFLCIVSRKQISIPYPISSINFAATPPVYKFHLFDR